MDIFDKEPVDWRDLQIKVGKLFSDMDFTVEIEKDIKTVRETVNVDVFAKSGPLPSEVILIECKNWGSAVPKTVVHSFRTVITDFGANAGYIISKKGFQRGAFDAVSNSNIHLFTFTQLLEAFKLRYINTMVNSKQITKSWLPIKKIFRLAGKCFR